MPHNQALGTLASPALFPWSKEVTSPHGWSEILAIRSISPARRTRPLPAQPSLSEGNSTLFLPPYRMVIAPHCNWTAAPTCWSTSKPELLVPHNLALGLCVLKMVPATPSQVLLVERSRPSQFKLSTGAVIRSPRLVGPVVPAPTLAPQYLQLLQRVDSAMAAICRWPEYSTATRARAPSTRSAC